MQGSCFASGPAPSDDVAQLQVEHRDGLFIAICLDVSMRGHGTYCLYHAVLVPAQLVQQGDSLFLPSLDPHKYRTLLTV